MNQIKHKMKNLISLPPTSMPHFGNLNYCFNFFIKILGMTVLGVFFIIASVNAQSVPKLQDPENQFIIDHSIQIDPDGGVIYFNPDYPVAPGELFTTYLDNT